MNSSLKAMIIVFAGSGFGGVARYGMQTWLLRLYPGIFPIGTFIVNLFGCFLIGLFYSISEKHNILTPEWRIALTTGFCGGFTTFSTFAYENVFLLKAGNYSTPFLYIGTSVILGIVGVFAGIYLVKWL
ncbi:fluoride efflux transporter CrcB [Panacibacter ginsenosidivorans]|nr:fluoride efflux transporter CrcB [Panacibacter ginsenosidivorans]